MCKRDKHLLYVCPMFLALSQANRMSVLKTNNLCINCMKSGHYVKNCKSAFRCKVCQKPHHSLLHVESRESPEQNTPAVTHTVTEIETNILLTTCKLLIEAPNGSMVEARGLIDSASSVSFVSERIIQTLRLPRSKCNVKFSGISGMMNNSDAQSLATFNVSPLYDPRHKINISAILLPRITCDLPVSPISFDPTWEHLRGLTLADPTFGSPGRIDVLLGADIFASTLLNGRRNGPPNTPVALETTFGWVLAGQTSPNTNTPTHVVHHVSLVRKSDDVLRSFWEIENSDLAQHSFFSKEEKAALRQYEETHCRGESGMFIVTLPRRDDVGKLGESRSKAVRRYLSLERSLHSTGRKAEFDAVMKEYFKLNHAEVVPASDLNKLPTKVFYLPMHAVRKDTSTTTQLRIVFDASAKSATGVSLNDTLLVGPTMHPSLIDVLLRFRRHRIAMIADVCKMYRAVGLSADDKDYHRFIWREKPDEPLVDYRMTRVTFGVSASAFITIMSMKQNAIEYANEYPQAYRAVCESFYVDDGLIGADSYEQAIKLQVELQTLFSKGGFLLRKWNSSDLKVLESIPEELRATLPAHSLPDHQSYTKTLGIEWNSEMDHFCLTISKPPSTKELTKRELVSDIAKTFDILGWFSPTTIVVKILLQRVWEEGVDWDKPVPIHIRETWSRWRSELNLLTTKHIPRCYFPRNCTIASTEIHGFCDASERAYAAVVYIRTTDQMGTFHTSLVISKTKVAPIKRLSIPRLELCGAQLLAHLLFHVKQLFAIELQRIFAWTDSTVVLSWLIGSPRRFKTFVGNRISDIVEHIPPDRWRHVNGSDNPADCASRGLYPSELLNHQIWWSGPNWLLKDSIHWPNSPTKELSVPEVVEEEKGVCLATSVQLITLVIPLNRYSSFNRIKRITAWMLRFIRNCQSIVKGDDCVKESFLSAAEINQAETYWLALSQRESFPDDMSQLIERGSLECSSRLTSLTPFLDEFGLIRIGGRQQTLEKQYGKVHHVIVHGKHLITKLIIRAEHIRLLHAGPTLLHASLSRRIHVIGGRRSIRSVIRQCVICRKISAKPLEQRMGSLPIERISADHPFNRVGIDFAGPIYTKYGYVRRPVVVKTYVCLFVSLAVKAVHLEPVSDLTTNAFLACFRRFVSRRGKPSLVMSDHGTNFVGAARVLKEMYDFFKLQDTQQTMSHYCSSHGITWKFIPERAPHFGGLWEAAVKSMKYHLRRVVGNTRLTFEELSTVLAEIEACLNSRPLTPVSTTEDSIEVLTPGHFLIGRPLEAIPHPLNTIECNSHSTHWHLTQSLVQHFWRRWSEEYLSSINRTYKWRYPSRNIKVGDIVILKEDVLIPTKWPLGNILEIHPGKDERVRVVTVKTSNGTYKRPVTKVVLLVLVDDDSIL